MLRLSSLEPAISTAVADPDRQYIIVRTNNTILNNQLALRKPFRTKGSTAPN